MAHFAKIENNVVSAVIVINNEIILDENGKEQEELGIDFCKSIYGQNTQWVQTSYNSKFRGKYAGIGDIYDAEKDIFVTSEPIPPSNP